MTGPSMVGQGSADVLERDGCCQTLGFRRPVAHPADMLLKERGAELGEGSGR